MKVLAIIDVVAGADMERVRAKIADELRGSWALFASGVLREAYAAAKPTRVLFVLEAENAAQADEQLRKLPLVEACPPRTTVTARRGQISMLSSTERASRWGLKRAESMLLVAT